MKLVMTLLARDEADIVDAQIAFHLHAGVDFVIATDNRSTDGTTEILERWERTGRLHLIQEDGEDMRQDEWVTRMARLAATEYGADWVINSDADEFWWPRGGTLKDVLSTVPDRYGVVRGAWRHFPPRPETDEPVIERMVVRLRAPGHPSDKRTVFHAHQKVAHRARVDVEIEPGNHNATGSGLEPLRGWFPIEVFHLSLRTRSQFETKTAHAFHGWQRHPRHEPAHHQAAAYAALSDGQMHEYFKSFVVGDAALERGIVEGTLAVDTRLRDAMRCVRSGDALVFERPSLAEEVAYAAELSELNAIEAIVRAEARVASLERRLQGRPQQRGVWGRRVD